MYRREILLAGAGGQGILFFGHILSLAAVERGRRVMATPSYGASVRGGEVKCGVILSDEDIEDPVIEEADIAVILNEASLKKFGHQVKEGGTLLYCKTEKAHTMVADIDRDYRLIALPLNELGPAKYHNMVALGILSQIESDLDGDVIKKALMSEMEKKGRENLIEDNIKSIQAGSDWYSRERKK